MEFRFQNNHLLQVPVEDVQVLSVNTLLESDGISVQSNIMCWLLGVHQMIKGKKIMLFSTIQMTTSKAGRVAGFVGETDCHSGIPGGS